MPTKCRMKCRIRRMLQSAWIFCHVQGRHVQVIVEENGNKCSDPKCEFSGKNIEIE